MDSPNYKVSIIIPLHNCEQHISRCVHSIRQQTEQNYEVIIINDGSTDNSYQVCQIAINDDNRFKLFSKNNTGVSDTRNIALSYASGETIVFVDADDWIPPNYLEAMLLAKKRSNADIVCCGFICTDGFNEKNRLYLPERIMTNIEALDALSPYYYSSVWGKLFKRSVIKEVKFETELYYSEDTLFYTEALLNSKIVFWCDSVSYNYFNNSNGALQTKSPDKFYTDYIARKKVLELYKIYDLNTTGAVYWFMESVLNVKKVFFENGIFEDNRISELNKSIKEYRGGLLRNSKQTLKILILKFPSLFRVIYNVRFLIKRKENTHEKQCVGIITFHSAINYGAVLQAVALDNAFMNCGITGELIDYRNSRFEKQYGLQKDFTTKNPIKWTLAFLLKNFYFFQKKYKFKKFVKTHSRISHQRYNFDSVKVAKDYYDFFVTGSDQVWNLNITDNDTRYFLDFVPNIKKKSYAASFGKGTLQNQEVEKYRQLLNGFDEISLREKDSKLICEQLNLSAKISVHIDPTLLFDSNWWGKLCTTNCKERYILFYKVAPPDKLIKYIEGISEKTGLKVIEIGSDLKKSSKKFFMVRNAGPEDFISLIKNAQCIATTSFHATVFSILFHKKIFLELVDKTGKFNVRIDNLLKILDIDYDSDKIAFIDPHDWNKIDKRIEEQRVQAYNYIKQMLSK